MKKQKGFAPLILIAIIAGLFVIGGWVYYWRKNQSEVGNSINVIKEESAAPITEETVGQKTYRNEKHKFELRYPEEWVMEEKVVSDNEKNPLDYVSFYIGSANIYEGLSMTNGILPPWDGSLCFNKITKEKTDYQRQVVIITVKPTSKTFEGLKKTEGFDFFSEDFTYSYLGDVQGVSGIKIEMARSGSRSNYDLFEGNNYFAKIIEGGHQIDMEYSSAGCLNITDHKAGIKMFDSVLSTLRFYK